MCLGWWPFGGACGKQGCQEAGARLWALGALLGGDGRDAGQSSLVIPEFCSLLKIPGVISLKGTWVLHEGPLPWTHYFTEHLLCTTVVLGEVMHKTRGTPAGGFLPQPLASRLTISRCVQGRGEEGGHKEPL